MIDYINKIMKMEEERDVIIVKSWACLEAGLFMYLGCDVGCMGIRIGSYTAVFAGFLMAILMLGCIITIIKDKAW